MKDFSLWWFDPDWKEACCARCGSRIWPEGDPDWGLCYDCFAEEQESRARRNLCIPCDICGEHDAVAAVCGHDVCSEECAEEAKKKWGVGKEMEVNDEQFDT